jgi:hypothetical protein
MLSFQMPKTKRNDRENTLHPIGENFLVQCVGYRGLAHRNSAGQWKSLFGNKTLPKNISFIPPVPTHVQVLPDDQPTPLIVPASDPVPGGPGRN